ncbi:MAG: hypothetical protein ACK54Z_01840 [Cyanobacteriota bacterium]
MKILGALRDLSSNIGRIGHDASANTALMVESIYRQRLSDHKNEFAKKYSRKYFSQADEDGITLEILDRIRSVRPKCGKRFVEFGVGDGCENNTLVLLSLGWTGSWFGGQDLAFNVDNSRSLRFHKSWIRSDSVISLYNQALNDWSTSEFDMISLDLDGNDYYFIESLLSHGARPPLFICEYNAIFPYGANWKMKFDDNHQWQGGNYFGASLCSFVGLFSGFDYFLCACNPQTGVNAFFVRNEYKDLFPEIPERAEDIYATPFNRLENRFANRVTADFIRSIFE